MSRISKVLVGMDFSDCSVAAFRWAASLAASLGIDLTVVMVAAEERTDGEQAVYADKARLERTLADSLKERLADLPAAAAHVAEFPPLIRVRNGRPAAEILETAEDEGADLIVLGTHGRQGVARALMGSVAEAVVRQAACPVVIVHAERGAEARPAVLGGAELEKSVFRGTP